MESSGTYFNRIFLLVNENCDSRCRLCDYWVTQAKNSISIEFVRDYLLPVIHRLGIKLVCISGGEPTLHLSLADIIAAIKEAGARVTLTTSTTRLYDHFERIAPLVDHYLVSLDGASAKTYRSCRGVDLFEHVVSWLRKLKAETSADVAVSCVLQRHNILDIQALYLLCRELNVDELFFRVPDLKSFAFGRQGALPNRTHQQVLIGQATLERLREGIEWVIEADQDDPILGQAATDLRRKVKWYEAIVNGEPYKEVDSICDVPLTSFVIEPERAIRPCFYLSQRQLIKSTSGQYDKVEDLAVFAEVYNELLTNPQYRADWCRSCQQFDGHKHFIKPE